MKQPLNGNIGMDDKKLSDAVNRSGFPLQIALQSLVERTRSDHECRVIFSEHFWLNPSDGRSGFIDLILEDGLEETVFVVECKRVVNCSWIFLIDDMKQMERRHAKAWVTESSRASSFWIPGSTTCTYDAGVSVLRRGRARP